ncbi:MAG: hypothetical protein JMDDDDMK_04700 [Acidobacteria bacterium]|nr:hypothetical protein [Acidobacteriota bacterium]
MRREKGSEADDPPGVPDGYQIEKGPDGKAEIHYTGIYKLFARWADDGSLEKAFIASVKHLSAEQKLDLSLLHGDGSNTVAKKGAKESATAATSTRRVKR